MVLSTVKEIVEDGRNIELPEISGRDFKAEIIELGEAFSIITSRLK